jgi:prevent-host-death family protein
MLTISMTEARTRLYHYVRLVAKGERIVITRRGVPIAMLVPVSKKSGARGRRS